MNQEIEKREIIWNIERQLEREKREREERKKGEFFCKLDKRGGERKVEKQRKGKGRKWFGMA